MLLLFEIFVFYCHMETFTYANDIFTIKLRCCVFFSASFAKLQYYPRKREDRRIYDEESLRFLLFRITIITSNFPNVQIAKTITHPNQIKSYIFICAHFAFNSPTSTSNSHIVRHIMFYTIL